MHLINIIISVINDDDSEVAIVNSSPLSTGIRFTDGEKYRFRNSNRKKNSWMTVANERNSAQVPLGLDSHLLTTSGPRQTGPF